MAKIPVHIIDKRFLGPYLRPEKSALAFCGKPLGAVHAYVWFDDLRGPPDRSVEVHMTSKGVMKHTGERFTHYKDEGYHVLWTPRFLLKPCKKCLNSEEFGLCALADL